MDAYLFFAYQGYHVMYNKQTRIPAYVFEKVVPNGSPLKRPPRFQENTLIPLLYRSRNEDYRKSGYDRGHMRAAANCTTSESLSSSFLLSNVAPMHPELNRGWWLAMERFTRSLSSKFDELYAITGPAFIPQRQQDGSMLMQYPVLNGNVHVPTHFFRILIGLRGTSWFMAAFLVPNAPVTSTLLETAVPLDYIQKVTGIDLVAHMQDQAAFLCRNEVCALKQHVQSLLKN